MRTEHSCCKRNRLFFHLRRNLPHYFPTARTNREEDLPGVTHCFEDNAEYGFGMRLAVDSNRTLLKKKVDALLSKGTTPALTSALKASLELWEDKSQKAIDAQDAVKAALPANAAGDETMAKIIELQDYFIDKSVWIIGGDGWAYDIGFGGVDQLYLLRART